MPDRREEKNRVKIRKKHQRVKKKMIKTKVLGKLHNLYFSSNFITNVKKTNRQTSYTKNSLQNKKRQFYSNRVLRKKKSEKDTPISKESEFKFSLNNIVNPHEQNSKK